MAGGKWPCKMFREKPWQGKDWRRELYVFLANYRAAIDPSTGKSPYQLCINRTVMIKLPTIMEKTPDTKAMQKDKNSKAKMKAYADQKRQVKPHNLNTGNITLVKQRGLNAFRTCTIHSPGCQRFHDYCQTSKRSERSHPQ